MRMDFNHPLPAKYVFTFRFLALIESVPILELDMTFSMGILKTISNLAEQNIKLMLYC